MDGLCSVHSHYRTVVRHLTTRGLEVTSAANKEIIQLSDDDNMKDSNDGTVDYKDPPREKSKVGVAPLLIMDVVPKEFRAPNFDFLNPLAGKKENQETYPPIVTIDGRMDTDIDHLIDEEEAKNESNFDQVWGTAQQPPSSITIALGVPDLAMKLGAVLQTCADCWGRHCSCLKKKLISTKWLGPAPKSKCCGSEGYCNFYYGNGKRKSQCWFPDVNPSTERAMGAGIMIMLVTVATLYRLRWSSMSPVSLDRSKDSYARRVSHNYSR